MRTLLAKRGWRTREPSGKATKAHSTARPPRCQGDVGQSRTIPPRKTRDTMPDDEISFPRRSGAGHVGSAPACAARRVCVGDAAAGIRRPMLGKSQCDSVAELDSGGASAVFAQARFIALRVLLRIGIGGRFAQRVGASGAACACRGVASTCDTPVSNGCGRPPPALARASHSFLIG
jgi:hypothetical protein